MKIKWYNDFTNKGESDMLSIAEKINNKLWYNKHFEFWLKSCKTQILETLFSKMFKNSYLRQ